MNLNELVNIKLHSMQKHDVDKIMKCNEITKAYGLTLTGEHAVELVQTRISSLSANRRVEFGGGVIDKIIKEFCNSSYICMLNYTDTLHELIEMFYYYKNETLDLISDDDLIKYMKKAFNGVCKGSLELLAGRELAKLARNLRYGYDQDCSDDYSEDDLENDLEDNRRDS